MASEIGGSLIESSVVFGYDTGYGVADNHTATRFYKGRPATNTILTGATWYGDGGNQTVGNKGYTVITDENLKYNGYETVLWTPGVSRNVYFNGNSDISTSDNSTVWTFSCYMRYEDQTAVTSSSGASVYLYYPNSDGSAAGTITDCGNGWYRVSRTRTGTSDNIGLAGFTGFVTNKKIYLSGPMLTKTDAVVPYIGRSLTRSNTAGLIDLARTTNIDISSMSFDSTGQLQFDGTDDKITLPANSYAKIGINDFTFEAIVKNTKTSNYNHFFSIKDQYHFAIKMQNTSTRNMYVYRDSSLSTFNAITAQLPSTTDYYYIACRRDNDNLELFINGESKGTKSGWGEILIENDSYATVIGSHGSEYNGGFIPVMKLHGLSLSDDEIKENYKSYKNRFNL